MASFDVIEASGFAYRLLWGERRYLMRLALVPLLVQIVCHAGVAIFGWETQFIKQALMMLPSYFTDGWMLAHLTRLIFLDQRWPFRPTGDRTKDMAMLQDRAQGIMGGTLFYVVIRFLMAGVLEGTYIVSQQTTPESAGASPAAPFFALGALALLVFMVWGFRFLWLYIPAALNAPVRDFLAAIRGFGASFYMMGAWLVSFVPLLMAYIFVTTFLFSLAGVEAGAGPETLPLSLKITIEVLRALMDLTIRILSTAAIAYGIRAMMDPRRNTGL